MTIHSLPYLRRRFPASTFYPLLFLACLIPWSIFGAAEDRPATLPVAEREELSAGDGTVFDTGHNAFGRPLRTMDDLRWNPFRQGKRLFTLPFTTDAEGHGLGPLFNASSCASCHFKDGRGARNQPEPPLLVRLSVEGPDGTSAPEPTYGGQLQIAAVPGTSPEGRLAVRYEEVTGHYADGVAYSLRRPSYRLEDLASGPLAANARMSVRMPPALVGLGLLEAIPEASLLAHADPDDRDGDGISGRANRVPDRSTGQPVLGRFGWKAGQPSLRQQNATALREDLGLTHPVLETTPDPSGPHNDALADTDTDTADRSYELSSHQVERLTLYTRLLSVPARRQWQDHGVLWGQALFNAVGCQRCHQPRFETDEVADLPELSRQVIRPYSDLLLHDMGEGLADGRSEALASGREWRTAPLWGLGLLDAVSGQTRLLHDGRARSAEEAILWHGGEGQASRDLFAALTQEERNALLSFLDSL